VRERSEDALFAPRSAVFIEGGEAYLKEADCPDGLCVGMGKISRSGQSIICLPHKVVVDIVGGDEEPAVDVTAG